MNTTVKLANEPQTPSYRTLPHNILAEQMLLGVLLTNNDALNRINDFLTKDHFFEPVHQRIFDAITIFIDRGMIANPVTLKNSFDKDQALQDIGGSSYLARLASLASTVINVVDYGKVIYDLAVRRKLITLGGDVVNDAFDNEIKLTAAEQIERTEQELFVLASEGQSTLTGFQALKTSLTAAINRAQLAFKYREKVTGVSTGYVDLDALLGGLQNSDLLILAARPSMGKTALAINLAVNCCNYLYAQHQSKKDKEDTEIVPPSVGFFSLEMSSEQLAARMLSMVSEISSTKLRSGHIDEAEFTKILSSNKTLHQLPFFIDDTPALTISALRTRARRLKRRHNLAVLFIDYLQLVRGVSSKGDGNRVQEVSEITQGLKAIAKELNIPVIALSQLSRAVESREDKKPLLSDLRESGSIEQDADIVMFIYREEYYVSRRQPREGTDDYGKWQADMEEVANVAEIIIAKQRNGQIGQIKLHFNSATTKFNNLA